MIKSKISYDEYRADPGRFFRSWIRLRSPEGVLGPFFEFTDVIPKSSEAKKALYKKTATRGSGFNEATIIGNVIRAGKGHQFQVELKDGMEIVWDPPLMKYGYVNSPTELGGMRYVYLSGHRQYRWGLNPNTVLFKRFALTDRKQRHSPNFAAFVTTQTSTMPYARNLRDIPPGEDIALSPEFAIRVAPEAPKTQLFVYHDDVVCGVLYKGELLVDETVQGLVRDKFIGVKYEATNKLLDLVG